MHLTETRRAIVGALLHSSLDHFEIASTTGLAPFRVLNELEELKRERVVRERIDRRSRCWSLTPAGFALAYEQAEIA